MALPSANRLKRRRDFQTVYKAGSRKSTLHLTLRALPFQTVSGTKKAESLSKGSEILVAESPTCIGISISQKVSKRAVIRNRIKRQIRAAFRQLLPRIQDGWWLVVVVRPEAVQCDYGQFLRELEQLLADAEVLDGP